MAGAVADQPFRVDTWPLHSKIGLFNEHILSINLRNRSVLLTNNMIISIDDDINKFSNII